MTFLLSDDLIRMGERALRLVLLMASFAKIEIRPKKEKSIESRTFQKFYLRFLLNSFRFEITENKILIENHRYGMKFNFKLPRCFHYFHVE